MSKKDPQFLGKKSPSVAALGDINPSDATAVCERRRREARRLGDLGECCKLSQPVRWSPAANHIWCIFGLKMLYLARPSRAIVNAHFQKIANRLCQVIFVSD